MRGDGDRGGRLYGALGLRRVVNADARLTRLGGSLMPAPVLAAMADAAGSYVDMGELNAAVGRRLAEITRNEAAHVCTGAAAGLFLAAAAAMAGDDPAIGARLPAGPAPRDEVIVHAAHRIPYDAAVRLAGAKLVQVGSVVGTQPWELEAAIGPRTAAVLFVAGEHLARGALTLEETVRIARAAPQPVPVVVDAAAQLPPPENLWRFTRELGADLAIFSGGKDLRGPQASGLIVGRAGMVAACAAQASPNQRVGRPMKVGKEELAGLLAAVELYLAQDHAARRERCESIVSGWVEEASGWPGVTARRTFPNEAGQPLPRALITFDPAVCGLSGAEVRRGLWEGDPRVAVAGAGESGISITPDTLEPGEEALVSAALAELLARARR